MKKLLRAASVFLFLCGCGIFLYPFLNEWYASCQYDTIVNSFKKEFRTDTHENSGAADDADGRELDRLYQDMQAYNEHLYEDGQAELKDPFSYEMPSFDLTDYGFKNNVIGIISIPAMDLELPLYLGASMENMAKGAVILGQTSMPTGGMHTNVVIAAHRGYHGIKMFRDIARLCAGDDILLTTPWDTLYYRVEQIKVVMPDDIDEVLIQEGEDMITLLTCHPYTKNSHRYLVFAKRLELNSQKEDKEADGELQAESNISDAIQGEAVEDHSAEQIMLEKYLPIIGVAVLFLIVVLGFWFTRDKKNSY